MECLRCEDSSNLFKTPKSVQCCQTGKLKSLIKLYYFEIIYRVSVISRRPSLPSLPTAGAGEGEREGGAVPTIKLSIFGAFIRGSLTVFDCIWMQRCTVAQYPPWT